MTTKSLTKRMPVAKAVLRFDDKEWKQFGAKFKSNASKVTEFMKAAYAIFGIRDIIEHFRREEGPSGRWEPRTPATQKRYEDIRKGRRAPDEGIPRAAYNPSNKLLQLTGDMRKSILPTNAETVNTRTILVFANDRKSGAHDRGEDSGLPGFFGMGKLPARPFMWLSNKAKKDMADFIGKAILP